MGSLFHKFIRCSQFKLICSHCEFMLNDLGNLNEIELFLHGSNLNAVDENSGNSAIMLAAEKGDKIIIIIAMSYQLTLLRNEHFFKFNHIHLLHLYKFIYNFKRHRFRKYRKAAN